jgi:hypothetical protein
VQHSARQGKETPLNMQDLQASANPWICPGMVDTFLSRSVLFSQSNLLELSRA